MAKQFFDPSRKKDVAATPEEAVRQTVVDWLVREKNVPTHLIETEFALGTLERGNAGRVDILVHGFRNGNDARHPWLLVECKRPGASDPAALQVQVNRYLRVLSPDFILLALGENSIVLALSPDKKSYRRVESLPPYGNAENDCAM